MRSKSYREYALFQGTGSFLNVFYIKPQIKSQVSKHRNKINTEKKRATAFPIYHQEAFRKYSGKRS